MPSGYKESRAPQHLLTRVLGHYGTVEVIRIAGGTSLSGTVRVGGAKNSALKLMTAALLAEGRSVITNVPPIIDVAVMCEVLRRLGCEVAYADETVTIDVPHSPGIEADYDLVRRMRASINVLGPLLTRRGEVKVAHPGGDVIGTRGLDYHIAGLEQMGATITSEHGFVIARAAQLYGAKIWLEFPSVGATENLLTAAVLAKGTTVIENAAREPEIEDLCEMLNAMGARVAGAGTSTIVVEGVEGLTPVEHKTVSDRIVAATWAFAAVVARGDITIQHGVSSHLEVALDKLSTAGAHVEDGNDSFRIRMEARPRAVDIVTLPYPGFATDMLPMAMALAAVSEGHSMLTENVFDARFMLVNEMTRLGASIRTDGHHAVIRGQDWLSGAQVAATDIRAGAGLALAALRAEGMTEISNVDHIDRGYPDFVPQLQSLGAHVERVTLKDPTFEF